MAKRGGFRDSLLYKDRECDECGEVFREKRPNQRFCCQECSDLWFKKRTRPQMRILERDAFRCIYCGKSSIEDGVKLHIDHIFPKVRGGEDIAINLVTACVPCNLSKNDRVFAQETIDRIRKVVSERNKAACIGDETKIKLSGFVNTDTEKDDSSPWPKVARG